MSVAQYVAMINYDNIVVIYTDENIIWEGEAKDFALHLDNYSVVSICGGGVDRVGLLVQKTDEED